MRQQLGKHHKFLRSLAEESGTYTSFLVSQFHLMYFDCDYHITWFEAGGWCLQQQNRERDQGEQTKEDERSGGHLVFNVQYLFYCCLTWSDDLLFNCLAFVRWFTYAWKAAIEDIENAKSTVKSWQQRLLLSCLLCCLLSSSNSASSGIATKKRQAAEAKAKLAAKAKAKAKSKAVEDKGRQQEEPEYDEENDSDFEENTAEDEDEEHEENEEEVGTDDPEDWSRWFWNQSLLMFLNKW